MGRLVMLALVLLGDPGFANANGDRVLLEEVPSLVLHAARMTAGRRSRPVPQIECLGPLCNAVDIETVTCKNLGSGGHGDVQWQCTAYPPMDSRMSLKELSVSCEGYSNRDDKYKLRGSCGVSFHLDMAGGGRPHRESDDGRRGEGQFDYGGGRQYGQDHGGAGQYGHNNHGGGQQYVDDHRGQYGDEWSGSKKQRKDGGHRYGQEKTEKLTVGPNLFLGFIVIVLFVIIVFFVCNGTSAPAPSLSSTPAAPGGVPGPPTAAPPTVRGPGATGIHQRNPYNNDPDSGGEGKITAATGFGGTSNREEIKPGKIAEEEEVKIGGSVGISKEQREQMLRDIRKKEYSPTSIYSRWQMEDEE
eukprot:Hpha_TRINITY_DN15391_c4_g2::TRINITY_DN15391_c4_g2_i1::g.90874::m.90874